MHREDAMILQLQPSQGHKVYWLLQIDANMPRLEFFISLLCMLHQLRIQFDTKYKANNHQHKDNAKIQHIGLSWAKQNRIINKRKTKITKLVHSIKNQHSKANKKAIVTLQRESCTDSTTETVEINQHNKENKIIY